MALISKQIIRQIESELYAYPQNIKTINEQRDDIMHGSHYPDVSVSGGLMSDTTQSKGMRLAQLETGWTELITDALTRIPSAYVQLIKVHYFEHHRNEASADMLHVGMSLYYAWKENAILCLALLASQKGLVDPLKSRESA